MRSSRDMWFGVGLRKGMVWLLFGFLLLGASAQAGAATGGQYGPLLGAASGAAPDFELKDLGDSVVHLAAYKGERKVLMYFWATWCPYCIKVKPELEELRKQVPESDLVILGINVGGGDTLERLKKFQEAHPVSWPILFDADGKVTAEYGVQGIPMFVLVNKEGQIDYKGFSQNGKLPAELVQALGLK